MTLKAFDEVLYIRNNKITTNKKGAKYMEVYGLDTETYKGEPMTRQWSNGKEDKIWFEGKRCITKNFLKWIDTQKQGKHDKSVIYVLNLLFDFCQLFYPHWKEIIKQEKEKGQFDFKSNKWNVKGFITEDSQFVELRKKRKVFWMVDIGRFFIGISLDKAIKQLLHQKGKKKPPKGLGEKKFSKKDKGFVDYALWDVKKTQEIGKLITKFHEDWDVTQTWSIAQLAERIFRHHFLEEDMKGCPYEIIKPALCSYHGGRNGFYVKPGMYKKVYSYDLISAYPYAMTQLPNFKNGDYYYVKKYEYPYIGIYKISGYKYDCKYPSFFSHDFKEIKGEFKDIWITSYEYEQALKFKEVNISNCEGYIFYPKCFEETPLQKYVKRFVELKQKTDKDNPNYEFYKRLLNALYGKFIQMREEKLNDNGNEVKQWITGQMFHPFIASLITGKVRAMIHDLEHRFHSIHTSTDSIKTLKPIPKKYLAKGQGNLGDLSLEVEGKCLILRSRLYLHYNKNDELKKFALHGFKGTPELLLKLWKQGKTEYKALRMIKPKEAIIQDIKPFIFEKQKRSLNF